MTKILSKNHKEKLRKVSKVLICMQILSEYLKVSQKTMALSNTVYRF